MWHSEDEDAQSDSLRKKAVKVKHVKRREKKMEKKVRMVTNGGLMMTLIMSLTHLTCPIEVCVHSQRGSEAAASQSEAASQRASAAQ